MAIAASDIKIYRGSKRDQTETAGGVPSGVVVVDGVVNNLFQNISRLDRIRGEIALEKIFVGVASANTDTFKGSFVAVCDPPFDENVNVMLIKSPSYASERADVVDQLERFYDLGPDAGNAKLAYGYLPGAEKIIYLLRWYEYTPRYNSDGSMIMSSKYDLKATMNIGIGDILWLGDITKNNGEYIEVSGVKTLYESMPDPDATHYYNKIYLEVNLASPLVNEHGTTDTTRRTARNSAWEIFGCMRLKSPLLPGDAYATVVDVSGRLIPVIEKNKRVTGQVVHQPAVLKNDVVIEAGGITINMEQVQQSQLTESVEISGASVSHVFTSGPVDIASVVFRYRHQKRWIVSESTSAGLFLGDVTGAVIASGKAMSLNLALAPDPGTVGIVTYLTQHQYEVCSNSNLIAGYSGESQSEIRNIPEGLTTYQVNLKYPSDGTLKPGETKIYAFVNGAFELVGQDDLFGTIGGTLSGSVDVKSSYKRVHIISFGGIVTRTLKFEFVIQGGEDYVISLPVPIDFRREKLVPGGVSGVVVSPLGALNFYDDKQGVLKLKQSAFGGGSATEVTDGLDMTYNEIIDICVAGENVLMLLSEPATHYKKLYISSNGGRSWVQIAPSANINSAMRVAYGMNNGICYYVINNGLHVLFSEDLSSWGDVHLAVAYYERWRGIAFGNHVAVLVGGTVYSEYLVVNNNGFSTIGSTVFSVGRDIFGVFTQAKFGADGDGNPLFVCSGTLGKFYYGNGSVNAVDWKLGIMPWADTVNWIEFSVVTNIWVHAGQSRRIAYSRDGIRWHDVSTSFFESSDTEICGLAVSDDGMFVISANSGIYSSRDGEVWEINSSHPEVSAVGQYALRFNGNDHNWVEMYRNPSSDLIELITHEQQELPEIVHIGTVNYLAGVGEITAVDGIVSVSSDMFLAERVVDVFAVHTNGAAPVTPGTFRLECRALTGATLVCTGNDAAGILSGDAVGIYNPEHGFAYGVWVEPYFPETLIMDAGYRSMYHPAFDGLNEKAFPLDGRVPLVKKDAMAMIADKGSYRLALAIDADELEIVVADIAGWPPVMPDPCIIEIGSEKIRIQTQIHNVLTVAERGYGETMAAEHGKGSIVFLKTFNMELNPVASVQAGTIEFANDVAHEYSAGAVVAAVIESGDLQAVIEEYHTQESWDNSTWYNSDDYAGNPAGGVYNFPDFPIVLTNIGCVTERWLIQVTSINPLTGQIRGENLGVIASGVALDSNVAPINPNVSAPYFFMNAQGFSGGWQVGNILRINTKGAIAPVWVARVVEAKASTASDDGAEIWIGGDVPVA